MNTDRNWFKALTTVVEPVRVLSGLSSFLFVMKTVFTHRCGQFILRSGGLTSVTVTAACLEVEDVVDSEF